MSRAIVFASMSVLYTEYFCVYYVTASSPCSVITLVVIDDSEANTGRKATDPNWEQSTLFHSTLGVFLQDLPETSAVDIVRTPSILEKSAS